MYKGVSYVLYTYDSHQNFVRSPIVEKFNPPLIFHNSNIANAGGIAVDKIFVRL